MQTFHTNKDFNITAQELDRQRLGKQRVEVLQIVKALSTGYGWVHHPATKMWSGHEGYLIKYGYAMINEWVSRGYTDAVKEQLDGYMLFYEHDLSEPSWWGDESVILSHKSNLLRKDEEHYSYDVPRNMPYLWPKLTDEGYDLVLSKHDITRLKLHTRNIPPTLKEKISV